MTEPIQISKDTASVGEQRLQRVVGFTVGLPVDSGKQSAELHRTWTYEVCGSIGYRANWPQGTAVPWSLQLTASQDTSAIYNIVPEVQNPMLTRSRIEGWETRHNVHIGATGYAMGYLGDRFEKSWV